MRLLFFSFLLALLLSIAACEPMPNGGIPFYLQCDSVTLQTDYFTQGDNSQGISDIWVESGSKNFGAYELPAQFPVLDEGEVSFVVSAGVKQSGQSGIRVVYPFYQTDTFTITATSGNVYKHTPTFRYKDAAKFTFPPEDFEASNGFNNMSIVSDTNVRYGTSCGAITVTITDSATTASQLALYDLPEGQEIWLEVDYKSEVPFWVGYFGKFGGTVLRNPVLFVNAKPTWTKLYLKLSETIGSLKADQYNLYFEALRPLGTNGGRVYIDNVKLVTF